MFNNDNNTTPFTIEETEDLTPRIRCLSDNVHQLQSPYASSIHPPITQPSSSTATTQSAGVSILDRGYSPTAEEHHSEGVRSSTWSGERQGCGNAKGAHACYSAEHSAGEAERTQSVSDIVSGSIADPLLRSATTKRAAHTAAPTTVAMDIETTGVDEDSIVTVACVWSPTTKATCFYGEDFTPVLELLDNATLIHTFNGIEFDLPRLAKHCGRSDIGAWVRKTVDPHYLMRYSMGFGGCMRLNDLLLANGFEPKSGSGLQAIQFWNEGNLEALSAYCMDDARLTYELCETRGGIVWGAQWRIHLWESRVMHFAGGN